MSNLCMVMTYISMHINISIIISVLVPTIKFIKNSQRLDVRLFNFQGTLYFDATVNVKCTSSSLFLLKL